MLDTNTEFGQRVARRLEEERIAWLTTVSSDGTPQPRPVWFLWTGKDFLIYSRPGTRKLEHITRNPYVSLNLDGDGLGGDIVVFTGTARVDPETRPANQVPDYAKKYQAGFQRIGMTADSFGQIYTVAIRVKPLKLRGH